MRGYLYVNIMYNTKRRTLENQRRELREAGQASVAIDDSLLVLVWTACVIVIPSPHIMSPPVVVFVWPPVDTTSKGPIGGRDRSIVHTHLEA